jgi:hypothetical protein
MGRGVLRYRQESQGQVGRLVSWTAYAIAAGERAGTSKRFSQNLVRLGCTKDIIDRARGFKGIELKHVDTSNQWQNRQDAEPPSDMPF